MGNNNCCATDRKPKKCAFTEAEREQLRKLWDNLLDKKNK